MHSAIRRKITFFEKITEINDSANKVNKNEFSCVLLSYNPSMKGDNGKSRSAFHRLEERIIPRSRNRQIVCLAKINLCSIVRLDKRKVRPNEYNAFNLYYSFLRDRTGLPSAAFIA